MEAQRKQAREMLEKLDNVEVIGGNAMIDVEAKAVKELEVFEENRPDVIIAFYATFSLGTIVPLVSQRLGKVPVILWSIPEPDPAGGRLQANSFCATNMNAHFLWRFHIPYFSVHGNIGEDKTQASLERAVRIVRSIKKVKNLRIGSIGGRVPGFYTSCC
jgi:L-fucose isomerase-like protein